MKLAVTIDVEEEGLFCGRYPNGDAPVTNVRRLERLSGLMSEFGIRPTLFVTWQVARHQALMDLLGNLCDGWRGEIGAHLHHWNTPPLEGSPGSGPIDSEGLPKQVLRDRLETLLETLRAAGRPCPAFRMGRFNLGRKMWAVLQDTEIRVDASIAPLRSFRGGPDHLAAPCDPYYPDIEDPTRPGRSGILEVPLTIVPVIPGLAANRWVARSRPATRLLQQAGSIPAQPMWIGPRRLKAAAALHRRRGGRVLTLFFHSSELMPGGSPKHPTEAHVSRFVEKLRGFFSWLVHDQGVEPATLSDVRRMFRDGAEDARP